MSDIKISELATGGALGGSEYVAIVQNGQTKKTTTANIAALGGGGVLISKTITQDGTYYAEDDDADGYESVTVEVGGGISSVDVIPILGFYEDGIQATKWRNTSDQYDISRISGTYTAQVGEYVEVNSTNNLLLAMDVRGSYFMFGIKCRVDPEFSPVNTNNWYQASCIMGQELGGTQRDFGIVIDKNGYFALGWENSNITPTSVNALDGNVHNLFVIADAAGSIRLFVDGVEEVVESITWTSGHMWQMGVFYNRDNGNTRVNGRIYRVGYFSPVKINGDYVVPTW